MKNTDIQRRGYLSCGTCVKYTAQEPLYDPEHDEMEKMVICNEDGTYTQIWQADDL